jgi:GT2 family glycosyltransferase
VDKQEIGPSGAYHNEPLSVGVVVVNWNGYQDTIECLESLVRATPRPSRVIVVDNGSIDRSIDELQLWAAQNNVPHEIVEAAEWNSSENQGRPEVLLTILISGSNRGFAGGNNLGLRYLECISTITHFLLLNNDATAAHDFFREIATALQKVPTAGLLSGTIYEKDFGNRVWYAGGIFVPLRALALHKYSVPQSGDPVATEFISGCAMLISRTALRTIGLLPECYFPLYMEDAEYCYRALKLGFPLVYAPSAVIYHKVGGTVGKPSASPRVTYCQNRHRGFFVRRNLRLPAKTVALCYLAITKPARALVETASGRPHIGWAVVSGTIAGLFSGAARNDRPGYRKSRSGRAGQHSVSTP